MNELSKRQLERADKRDFNRLRLRDIEKGKWLLPWCLRPCRMKILIVGDGYDGGFVNISFGQLYFSLSALVDTLENDPDWWVQYDLTKAHRQHDPLGEADMEEFRFTQAGFNINDYDQVWFFGARTNENDAERLADDELAIISRWMDEEQGGVFAVGDHADFGASLCSRIPRASTMRKWTPGQGVPQANGLNRHDTLRKGHDGFYTFNDESDDIPMTTRLRRYPRWSFSPFSFRWSPHPILCGKDGPIDVLPDHPHEGEVIDPVTPAANFTFNGYSADEYPEVNGHRELPDIIAWARVQGDHTAVTDLNKGAANAKEFGAIGAYDGHRVNVGRVVVDSTWHHWMDVNLIGRSDDPLIDPIDPVPSNDPKAQGFNHSQAGRNEFARIKEYFLNVAKWLGAPAKQNCMFMRATWGIICRYPLAEQLSPRLPIWELGGYARDAIGRRASQCTLRYWLIPWFPVWRKFMYADIGKLEDIRPPVAQPNWDIFETYVMGGMTREMLLLAEKLGKKGDAVKAEMVADCMARGLKLGAQAFDEDYQGSIKDGRKMLEISKSLIDADISAKAFLHEK